MLEHEGGPPEHQKLLPLRGAMHLVASTAYDPWVCAQAVFAPKGKLLRPDGFNYYEAEILAEGKVVRYGGTLGILDKGNLFHIGNHLTGDFVLPDRKPK